MQTAEASLFKGFHVKPCIFAKLSDVFFAIDAYISLTIHD